MKKCGLVADMVDGSRPSSQCHQGKLVIGHQLRVESIMAGAIHIWHHFIAALQVIDGPRGSRSNPIDYQGKARRFTANIRLNWQIAIPSAVIAKTAKRRRCCCFIIVLP